MKQKEGLKIILFGLALIMIIAGCSGSGTISGSPRDDGSADTSSDVTLDCNALEADLEAACGDKVNLVTDLDSETNLETMLPHVVCSRTFSTGDNVNAYPSVAIFIRTHISKQAQQMSWQVPSEARELSLGEDGYVSMEETAYSDIETLVAHQGAATLQIKNIEWTKGTKPPAICTTEEVESLAAMIMARI